MIKDQRSRIRDQRSGIRDQRWRRGDERQTDKVKGCGHENARSVTQKRRTRKKDLDEDHEGPRIRPGGHRGERMAKERKSSKIRRRGLKTIEGQKAKEKT